MLVRRWGNGNSWILCGDDNWYGPLENNLASSPRDSIPAVQPRESGPGVPQGKSPEMPTAAPLTKDARREQTLTGEVSAQDVWF